MAAFDEAFTVVARCCKDAGQKTSTTARVAEIHAQGKLLIKQAGAVWILAEHGEDAELLKASAELILAVQKLLCLRGAAVENVEAALSEATGSYPQD